MACLAYSFTSSGVLKSGSPILKLMTSLPLSLSYLSILVMAKVSDSAIAKILFDNISIMLLFIFIIVIKEGQKYEII
ncbi:MAG: hypothetical protein RR356_04595 [Bacteroidales bacterium]